MLDYPFHERLLVVDMSAPQGGFRHRKRGTTEDLSRTVAILKAEGVVDRVVMVPWMDNHQRLLFSKYFGKDRASARSQGGTAVYQYLYGLDECDSDYVLHLDSDMLVHCGSADSWIDMAVREINENPLVMFATLGHPPRAESRREWLFGNNGPEIQQLRCHDSYDVSTRRFLYNRRRFEDRFLPLYQMQSDGLLEQSMSYTLKARGFVRRTLFHDQNWAVHPKPHNVAYLRSLDELIWGVERGVYPFRRGGRYPWDLYTYRRHLATWLLAIRLARLLGRA